MIEYHERRYIMLLLGLSPHDNCYSNFEVFVMTVEI